MSSCQLSVERGYALWAASYDHNGNALIAAEERAIAQLITAMPQPGFVLDVGTGTGRHALRWARLGSDVIALDQSPQMLRRAQSAARRRSLRIEFVPGSLDAGLPFDSNSFDLVVCALVLCHQGDLSRALQELGRLVVPGGHLLITDLHPESVRRGWRVGFFCQGKRYVLPTVHHSRDDYVKGMLQGGCQISHTIDVPVGEVPDGVLPEEFRRQYADFPFCLILLGKKT